MAFSGSDCEKWGVWELIAGEGSSGVLRVYRLQQRLSILRYMRCRHCLLGSIFSAYSRIKSINLTRSTRFEEKVG
jgi:hypothetical protein